MNYDRIVDKINNSIGQFRWLHSRQVQHTFRFYSQQWRTWAACFIQAAWRRHCKRKMIEQRYKEELEMELAGGDGDGGSRSLGTTFLVSNFAANALRGVHRNPNVKTDRELVNLPKPGRELVNLPKPLEQDFTADDD
ncbi:putative IQ motif, EF-hand binding protein [Helianthus annuus]|nr:putative IQ motif, EF-hand binding protein [Helianthus annuus]KAJ0575078.1 putative IQ motif, EF-hand binding protein [Helianthus annuus]KAJ0921043.1 putative IQ motif, EF-hand binding protein [Helianthus annuus]